MADTVLKRRARARQRATGEKYTVALAHVRSEATMNDDQTTTTPAAALTEEQILEQAEAIRRRRSEELLELARATEQRIEDIRAGRGTPFDDDDLLYAAGSRCDCGAGMAYPHNIGMRGAWHCSAILTGRAPRIGEPGGDQVHTGALPFAFWSVKAEGQPSVMGRTTRPPKPCPTCETTMERTEVRQGVPPVRQVFYRCPTCEPARDPEQEA